MALITYRDIKIILAHIHMQIHKLTHPVPIYILNSLVIDRC